MTTLSQPTVSVVVPAHNAGPTIERCLESILAQGYPGLELIVVDDASSDDTIMKVSKYPVKFISNSKNCGAAYSRNLGAENTNSEILLFIDSDIVIPPSAISKAIKSITEKPEVMAIGGVYSENTQGLNFISDFKNMDLAYRTGLCQEYVKYVASYFMLIRRSAFEKAGGFSTDFFKASVEDIDLGYRVTKGERSMFIDKGILVDHLKRHTFFSMLKTDYTRIVNMMKIIKDSKGRHRAGEQAPAPCVMNTFLAGLILLSFLILPFFRSGWLVFLPLLAFLANNFGFAHFLYKKRNIIFAVKSLFVLFIEYVVVDISLLISLFISAKGLTNNENAEVVYK